MNKLKQRFAHYTPKEIVKHILFFIIAGSLGPLLFGLTMVGKFAENNPHMERCYGNIFLENFLMFWFAEIFIGVFVGSAIYLLGKIAEW